MQRLIAANSVPKAQADVQPTTGTPEYATVGNPNTSTPATVWPAYAFNMIMDEIVQVIEDAGITLDGTQWDQLSQAVLLRGGGYAADTGALNAMAIELATAPPSLTALVGVPLRVKVLHSNTAATSLNVNDLGAVQIIQGGIDLVGGELIANGTALVVYDGTTFELLANGNGAINVAAGLAGNQAVNIAQFIGTLAGTGYQKLPSGLIIQWASISITGTSPHTFTYPVAFPNNSFIVGVFYQGETPPSSGAVGGSTVNNYSFSATNTASSTNGCYFIALGN